MNATDASTNWTLLDMLNWTTEYFKQSGIEDARLNAELLLSEATGMERIMLYARFEEQVLPQVRERYREMVKKRAQRCPLQYVLGYTEFYGRRFNLDGSVLIPRPETELLVERSLELLASASDGVITADMGTGSGAIAVTLACEKEGLKCIATDISDSALEIARANASLHGVQDRITFREGDVWQALESQCGDIRGYFDMIVSNPPYVPSGDVKDLQPEVGEWEPLSALDGGEEGVSVIREVIKGAPDLLKPGGWLVMEIGEKQADKVRGMIEASSRWRADTLDAIKDGGECDRVLSVRTK